MSGSLRAESVKNHPQHFKVTELHTTSGGNVSEKGHASLYSIYLYCDWAHKSGQQSETSACHIKYAPAEIKHAYVISLKRYFN